MEVRLLMYLDELFLEEEIESKIKFNKEMVTVYGIYCPMT